LDVQNSDGIEVLTLNRPEAMNALVPQLVESLIEALRQAATTTDTRVVVLAGAPPAFCAGMDVNVFANRHETVNANLLNNTIPELFETLIDFPKPVVAGVNGPGVGLGTTILGLCDIVIMGESAKLSVPFTALGVMPEACSSYTFPRLMGTQAANWFFYSSQWMDAAACKAAGLALDVVPDDALLDHVIRRARTIAVNSLESLLATKQVLMGPRREHLRETYRAEMSKFSELLDGPACAEGMQAFFEKRSPQFIEAGL